MIPNIREQTDRRCQRRRSGDAIASAETAATAATGLASLSTLATASRRRKSHHNASDYQTTGYEPHLSAGSMRKKSVIDSGFEMLFKKCSIAHAIDVQHLAGIDTVSPLKQQHTQHRLVGSPDKPFVPDVGGTEPNCRDHQHQHHQQQQQERGKWRPFESIKIYTERRKSMHEAAAAAAAVTAAAAAHATAEQQQQPKFETGAGDRTSKIYGYYFVWCMVWFIIIFMSGW